MKYARPILALLCLAAGCTTPIGPQTGSGPAIVVDAPVTVAPGAVQFTFPPGAIVVNVQIGSDKTPLVNVSVQGHVFSATMPATQRSEP